MAKTDERTRYYVRNPITLGQHKYLISVVGYDDTKGKTAPYTIGRGHVIEVPTVGCEAPVEKWLSNRCIEPYHEKRHPNAILEPVVFASHNPVLMGDDDEDDVTDENVSQAKPISDMEDEQMPEKAPARRKPHDQSSLIATADPRGV